MKLNLILYYNIILIGTILFLNHINHTFIGIYSTKNKSDDKIKEINQIKLLDITGEEV